MSSYQFSEPDECGRVNLTVETTRVRGPHVAKAALAVGLDWDLDFGDGDIVRLALKGDRAQIGAIVDRLRELRFQCGSD